MTKKKQQPTITTARLILRPYRPEDAPDLQRLIGERAIAATTARIPHPYEDGMAEEYIGQRQEHYETGKGVHFAITHRDGFFIGGIGIDVEHGIDESMQLGYWVGKPYWNQGYCTEAVGAVLDYGFTTLNLHRIYAWHFGSNPASGRVMQKAGMKYEGKQREAFKKWGKFEDLVVYGILRSEFPTGE